HNYSETEFNYPEHEVEFTRTIDEERRIRETIFKPELSGVYSFMLESNRVKQKTKNPEILVDIDGDSNINYSTFWGPVCFSGQKYLEAGKEYKVTLQNTNGIEPGRLLYNGPDHNKTVFSSPAGNAIDYYFVHGDGPAEIISEYQRLTGKAPMFPKTAYGFWQCRERYHDQAELLENAREYREREIPVDNIVQDWFYWPEGTKGPEWDRERYPDPQALNAELASLNLQLMVSVWPEVKNTPLLEKYNLEKYKLEGTNFLDFTVPGVGERYYRMLSDSMFHFGVSSIWLDGTEPEQKPAYDFPTAVAPFEEVANCYSLLVTKSMYEGKRKEFPGERVFNLTRSAYAGQQRYGATSWSGDIEASWEQFSEQIAAGLNFTMAGNPYWTHDIGGFFRDSKSINPEYDNQYTNEEFIELLTRWFQFGTFNPIFRIHGYVSETEIWRYGKEFEDIARKFIDIRYQLMPYIYSEAWRVSSKGTLMMSPLVYQYPDDKNTWGIKDQFFFGESLLICPVMKYKARSRELYLPEGNWYNFWTGELIGGGDNINAPAPMDEPPIYVKAGTILPIGPKIQYATQKSEEALRIKVYPGMDAEYTLYFDDNESYEYERGVYSELLITYSDSGKEIKINSGSDKFIDFEQNPMDLIIEMEGADREDTVRYIGDEIKIKL
ncbi:MAG: glycoside hydrolase family 31 protein, partial [Bacteroides sp.]|nr:glycoside hydrolase family 31 protein [Bacteroides sp.]